MTDTISQKTRLIVLGAEVVILCVGSYFAFGEIFPPNSDKGFWFYTALLGLILGNRLHAPFFAKPADVIIYAAPAVTALLLANSWANWEPDERLSFVLAVSYCVIAAMLSGIAILVMGSGRASLRRAAEAARVLAEVLGAPRIIFSVVILFALYTFHRSAPRELLAIGAAWVLTVAMSPIEGIARLWARLQRVWLITEPLAPVAEVVAFQTPGIVLLRKH